MRITVFGASGKVGSLVVEEALRRGHTVVAFVHNRDLFVPNNKLIVQKGDVYNATDVAKAVQGSDAVVSCLGSWGTPKKNVLSAAMRAIIPAMRTQKITRIVTLTGSGAIAPGVQPSAGYKLMMQIVQPFPAGLVFHDGEEHMRLLAASGLTWTTLRSPIMNNMGSAAYKLDARAALPLATIKRQAVANALLDQLDSDEFLVSAPIIHRT